MLYTNYLAGAVPKFEPTSSPEIDAVLTNFRNTIFLPAHLTKQDAQLVYGTKHKREIETTPHIVEIAGEEFRLQHIDRTKDIANQAKGMITILNKMQKSDWNIFPSVLEGLHSAGRTVPEELLEKSIRLAATAGRLDVIIECARRVARTNFALNSRSRAAILMFWVQFRALDSGFEAKKTEHTLRMAEQVAALLEEPLHAGNKQQKDDPRTSPEITGALLELSAANAKAEGGKDVDGSVEKYAKRFIATFQKKELEGFLVTQRESQSLLLTYAPIRWGVKTAIEVLDKQKSAETVSKLEEIKSKLDAKVTELVSAVKGEENGKAKRQALSITLYEKLEALN